MIMMRKPPWHTLNLLPGQKGVKADWQDFPEKLLKPTQELAEAFPCPKISGCYMDVVKRPDGSRVGICANDHCDKRQLQKTDLIVYRPDLNALFAALGQPFGTNASAHTETEGVPHCWQIGEYNPAASYRFPIIVSFVGKASKIELAIGYLAARLQKPFFMLLPAASAITQSVQDVAQRNSAKLFAFEDIIEISASGSLQTRSGIQDVIRDSTTCWIRQLDGAVGEFRYPTPAGAEWKSFLFEFTADEKMTASYKNANFVQVSPEDLGMRDKRSKKPTKAWAFMKALAKVSGQMPVKQIEDVKKTKQEVSKALKRIFQMQDDPIAWSAALCGYQANFAIRKSGRFQSEAES